MTHFQAEKSLVRSYYADLDAALNIRDERQIVNALAKYTSNDYQWYGFHPFNEQKGSKAVAHTFWQPLAHALTATQRRLDIFIAGQNDCDGFTSTWVASMGHIVGLFDNPWLGIPPTRKMAFLRYAEFHRVVDSQIVHTAMYCDIPHVMMQAGLSPFAPQTAAHLVQPGPLLHDALLFDEQTPDEGTKTLSTINAMINDLGNWQSGLPLTDELARTWHDDMIWWGPAGIGATYTIERYAEQHAGLFRSGFKDRQFNGHVCRLAEGHYGGFFGWPNFTAIPSGGFMNMPATSTRGEFRVIDMYRRAGDKLAENWVFIDLLHFWHQQGVDILQRATHR